jgi:hypothetical protein
MSFGRAGLGRSFGRLGGGNDANRLRPGTTLGSPGTPPLGWAISSGGGITRTIAGIGTEDGIDYLDFRLQAGSALNAFLSFLNAPYSRPPASQGQQWTWSLFVKVAGGSLSNVAVQTTLDRFDGGGSALSSGDFQSISPTSGSLVSNSFSQVRTASEAGTASIDGGLRLIASGAYDVTLRLGGLLLRQTG